MTAAAKPPADQGDLFGGDELDAQRRVGRTEYGLQLSLRAAQLVDLDRGAAALALELARAVDVASVRRDPYGVAAAARELREQLQRLRLDPVSREGTGGTDLEAFLASLADTG